MNVHVLCGGRGTRLGQPVKCLTEVAGRPFMDWKLNQLYRHGATQITLIVGPFAEDFAHYNLPMVEDDQTGIQHALKAAGTYGWWTMGDVLLEQPLHNTSHPLVYVRPGTQIGGLWHDCGLYYGQGPWTMTITRAFPHHINTPTDLEGTSAYLHRLSQSR